MSKPEDLNNQELIRDSVVLKIQQLLEGCEPVAGTPSILEEEGLIPGVFKAIYGQKFERRGSLEVSGGYGWMAVTEYSRVRFGKSKVNRLIVNGDAMIDSEGRHTERLWHFDLLNEPYSVEEYELLEELLDSEGDARDELFYRIADLRT